MLYGIQAACGCHMGRIRKNNEDNVAFGGVCLPADHNDPIATMVLEGMLKNGLQFAVFDGMGGEHFGELASFAAAARMADTKMGLTDFFAPERYINNLTQRLHEAVIAAQRQMHTEYMGTTMVSLHFLGRHAWVCNVGDSRAYRLREGSLTELSVDHVEKRPLKPGKKAPLTQHLGYGAGEVQLEPFVAASPVRRGDIYLLCSDGLTDMLPEHEICDILCDCQAAAECVDRLIHAALDHGGRDNITVIVCKIR